MKIAVFGKGGQVSTELVRRAPDGVSLDVYGRDRVEFILPDLVRDAVRHLEADAIINVAAYTAVDRAETEPEIAKTVNGTSVAALGEAAAERGIPVVHVSTDYVFDGAGDAPRRPDEKADPASVYGESKLAGEIGLRDSGATAAILRTSWVFSAHGGNFVKTMLTLGKNKTEIPVVNDQVGGPTPAAAIADTLYEISRALADGHAGGTYHYSGAPNVSWADFAREIFRQAGLDVSVVDILTKDFQRPAKRPLNSRLDCTTTEAEFGIARPDWRKGLEDVLRELAL